MLHINRSLITEFITHMYRKLDCTSPVAAELIKNGVVVVPNVIPEEDCKRHIKLIHEWLDRFGPNKVPDSMYGTIIHKYNIGRQ